MVLLRLPPPPIATPSFISSHVRNLYQSPVYSNKVLRSKRRIGSMDPSWLIDLSIYGCDQWPRTLAVVCQEGVSSAGLFHMPCIEMSILHLLRGLGRVVDPTEATPPQLSTSFTAPTRLNRFPPPRMVFIQYFWGSSECRRRGN